MKRSVERNERAMARSAVESCRNVDQTRTSELDSYRDRSGAGHDTVPLSVEGQHASTVHNELFAIGKESCPFETKR